MSSELETAVILDLARTIAVRELQHIVQGIKDLGDNQIKYAKSSKKGDPGAAGFNTALRRVVMPIEGRLSALVEANAEALPDLFGLLAAEQD